MPLARRHALMGAAAALAAPRLAAAQGTSWPSRPITIVVPNPPGGGTDFAARLYVESLTRQLGQQVLIDNRPGGNGNIAIVHAVRSAPDGHTLLLQYSAFHAGNPIMIRNAGWDPNRDLTPVGMATIGPHAIFVAPTVPANTLAEFIAWAKERPGRVNYASAGVGSVQHIAALQFSQAIGVPMEHVTYRGAAAALQDVAGGRVEMFITTPSSAIGLVQAGRVKALAIASQQRISALPTMPTTAEAGMPGFVVDAWFAIFAPAGTPAPVVERINAAMRTAAQEADVKRRAEEGGVFLQPLTVAEMDQVAKREVEVLGRFIRENNITME